MKYKTSYKEILIYLMVILGCLYILLGYKEPPKEPTEVSERVLVAIILNKNIEETNNSILGKGNENIDIVFLEHLREMKDCLNLLLYDFSDEEKSYYEILLDERKEKNEYR